MNTNNKENLLEVLQSIMRWKKAILVVTGAAIVLAALISLIFLRNYYKPTTIFYAANPSVYSPSALFGKSQKDLEFFGESEDIDRMMSIANSSIVADYLIEKYNLYKHYDIDTSGTRAKYNVRKRFNELFEVKKNERDAIELSIEDRDPVLATQMTNDARVKINEYATKMLKDNLWQIFLTSEKQIKTKTQKLNEISDTLIILRSYYGIYDAEKQSEQMARLLSSLQSNITSDRAKLEAYRKKNSSWARDSIRKIEVRLLANEQQLQSLTSPDTLQTDGININRFNKGIGIVRTLEAQHKELSEVLGEDLDNLDKIRAALEASIPALYVQDEAAIPTKKFRPKRSIIVLSAGFIAFVASILIVLLLESYRDVDWAKIINPDSHSKAPKS